MTLPEEKAAPARPLEGGMMMGGEPSETIVYSVSDCLEYIKRAERSTCECGRRGGDDGGERWEGTQAIAKSGENVTRGARQREEARRGGRWEVGNRGGGRSVKQERGDGRLAVGRRAVMEGEVYGGQ